MRKTRIANESPYYLLLFLLILFTSGLAFLLMPLIMVGKALTIYLISLTMGIVFGLFVIFFVMDLEDMTHHHHAGIWAAVLFGSLLNFTVVFINKPIITDIVPLNLPDPANSFIAGALFAFGFFIPYIIYLANEHKLNKHAQKSS